MDEIKRFFQISKNDAVALRAMALRIHQAEETKNEAAAEVWRKHFSDIAVDVITLGFDRRQVARLEGVAQKILEAHKERPINAYTWADGALMGIGIYRRELEGDAPLPEALLGEEQLSWIRLPVYVWDAVLYKTDMRLLDLRQQREQESA